MTPLDRLFAAAFDTALGLWPRLERREYGDAMRDTFRQRLDGAPRFLPARAAWVTREVASAAWQGLGARLRPASGRAAAGGGLVADARYALRGMARRPRFTLLTLVTLGGGLGLVISSFTVVERTLLSPLPFPDGDRLVAVWSTQDGKATRWGNMSWLDVSDLRTATHTLAALGGYTGPSSAALAGSGHPTLVEAVRVTPGFFDVFGLTPERGRLFEDADHRSGRVALLSHDAWVSRFGGDPAVVGRAIQVDDENVTIVGVLPRAARWFPAQDVEVWLPYHPGNQSRGSRNLVVVGRVATGATLSSASTEIHALTADLARTYPDVDTGRSAELHPLAAQMMGTETPRVFELLLAATAVLLLLACANVAGLHLARASERSRELALQVSLGASRLRVVRPLVFESLFVATGGGALAVAVAAWLPGFVLAHAPTAVPRAAEVHLDAPVLLLAGALTLVSALVSSAVPAWSVARRSVQVSLAGGRTSSSSVGALRGREALVVGQVAGALALLAAAGLLVRSVRAVDRVAPGVDPSVLSVGLRLEPARYPDAAAIFAFHDELLHSLEALPGVERVAAVSMLPFTGDRLCDDVAPDGGKPTGACTEYRSATPGYLATMGISLLSGRDFASDDARDAPRVAILSESLARTLFPAGRAVGGRIQGRGTTWQVVGVAADVHTFGLSQPAPPTVYLPFRQAPFRLVTAVLRAHDPKALAPDVSKAIWAVDPLLAVRRVAPLGDLIDRSAASYRFRSRLFTAFGGVAVGLALLGIAGLLYQVVHQRRREIGIRMAMGSTSVAVVGGVLRRAASLIAVGAVLGWGLSVLAGRALASFLFGIAPTDPWSVAGALGLVVVAALAAAAGPALRAASLDPVRMLRED